MKSQDDILLEQAYSKILLKENETIPQNVIDAIKSHCISIAKETGESEADIEAEFKNVNSKTDLANALYNFGYESKEAEAFIDRMIKKTKRMQNESTHTLSTISNPLKQSLLDSLEKYLKEGEHQDGEGFYRNYETAGDLAEDFARHLKTSVNAKDDSTDEYGFTNKMSRDEQLRTNLGSPE